MVNFNNVKIIIETEQIRISSELLIVIIFLDYNFALFLYFQD